VYVNNSAMATCIIREKGRMVDTSDMPLHQALYVFNVENTILQCIKHKIRYMGNKM